MEDKTRKESDIGFIQGVVYACAFLVADCDEPTLALDIWNSTNFTKDDLECCDEYDVRRFQSVVKE